MASRYDTPILSDGMVAALGRSLVRALGVVVLALAAVMALALAFHHPADPSWNQATSAPVENLMGYRGAVFSDLMFQGFGVAAWLLPLAIAGWGLRIVLLAPHPQPIVPLTALPLALLCVPAALAHQNAVAAHIDGGLPGGLVGYELWSRFALSLGDDVYGLVSLVLAVLTGLAALSLRPVESLRIGGIAGRLTARAARWTGGQMERGGRLALGSARELAAHAWAPRRRPVNDGRTRTADDGVLDRTGRLLESLRQPEPAAEWSARTTAEPFVQPVEAVEVRQPAPAAARYATELPVAATPAPVFDRKTAVGLRTESGFDLPGLGLLGAVKHGAATELDPEHLDETSRELERVLDDFGVRGAIIDAKAGPVVTLYELEPAPGTRAARVINLSEDIARSLAAVSVRVAVVRGRSVIGIELPNPMRETVYLKELMASDAMQNPKARLPLCLGKDISGEPVVADLARMPHLLIAGTTGSGKSVAINAMILSLLYRHTPEEVRLIMIDPKVIELSVYDGIPHLLSPVVTEPAKAVIALKWAVRQMDHRYRLMSHLSVRDIHAYNRRLQAAREAGEELTRRVQIGYDPTSGLPQFEEQPIDTTPLPQIVVIVDEVADLMLTAGKEVEGQIQRLSQKARAAGIHLIVATQRPSVDVLTGVIKANLPCRISFRVSSKIDSRTILGEAGAEQLLGQGDMLFMNSGEPPRRVHGPLVTDAEVERVVNHLKNQGQPDYLHDVTSEEPASTGAPTAAGGLGATGDLFASNIETGASEDAQYQEALRIVAEDQRATTSFLQRKMRIGYNTAARLIERMEEDGYVSAADHVGRRQVLVGREETDEAY
ncbi:MAG: DNA translocase FtsK [Geminicoccaceae bacterium]|nr:MAG: DNA translocase FtsK [Geminicoccaceae bacterium]